MEIEVNIPNGESGAWKIEEFEVSEKDVEIFNLRAMFHPGCRIMYPGKYKKLTRNGEVIMSNTHSEIEDHSHFIYNAKRYGGNILINGLGLGVALIEILKSDLVKKVTVVEKSEDVIKLVAPYFSNDKRVKIIHADALEFKPPKEEFYDFVWHDIWDDITADNLPEMRKLHRKYGKKTNWQGSWCRDLCERYK